MNKIYHIGHSKKRPKKRTRDFSCKGKIKHTSKGAAFAAAKRLAGGLALLRFDIYECKWCTKELQNDRPGR